MNEWLEFGKTFGAYVLIIAALFYGIALFINKLLWPFILLQQEKADKAKEQERLDRIEERNLYLESIREFRQVLENMNDTNSKKDEILKSIGENVNKQDEIVKGVLSSLTTLVVEVKKNGRQNK